jgi:hypothetical protein
MVFHYLYLLTTFQGITGITGQVLRFFKNKKEMPDILLYYQYLIVLKFIFLNPSSGKSGLFLFLKSCYL